MKNKIVATLIIIILFIQNMTIISCSIEENEIININIQEEKNPIYVQHDSNNKDIYLLKSKGKTTIVYQIIDATYTPCKQWTKDGIYIDDLTGKISATSKENYISVKENEIYFVRLYGIGDIYRGKNNDEYHITTPIVYFDDKGNCIGSALSGTYSSSKSGVEITIPANATKMYISNYNNQGISIQKKLYLNEEEFNKIKEKQDKILNSLDSNYEEEKKDKMLYDELDKCYITFVQDDSRADVDKFADLFISKNTPLCFAAIGENLLNTASNLKETRLDVAHRVQNAGGEILAHNGLVITEDTMKDENFMYNYFVVQKQMLTNMGFDVNGIILAGGQGQIAGSPITAKWANSLYKYSDLLGEKYQEINGYESTYFHYRTGLSNYKNDIDKIKKDIDTAIKNKDWKVFYFHDENEITKETLEEIIDYINSKEKDKVEVVTYKTMYNKFAKRESKIKNDVKTYYVSNSGTSQDGTNINTPINFETLKTKKIKSGDTILFKRGDTFYDTLDLSITKMNDKKVKISSYGEGNLPTFSSYKYVQNNWEWYADNIYRIDIKNTSNFTGYTKETDNAYNVGFIEDDKNNKYYNKKKSIDELNNKYDFYSDGMRYLYMCIDKNPYEELGNLKIVFKNNLMILHSNMETSNIRFAYSGGHAIVGSDENVENININNCIIENVGGSYLYNNKDTRYGNGIEFYGCNAKNIIIKDNIFRNIYDVAFTIQGTKGSGNNVDVYNNVFVNNSQDSEIWENGTATGITNYTFHDNISINQGRGWGYEARPDKYAAGHILFWGYNIKNTKISFNNNLVYNPRRIYFIEQTNGTNIFFKENDYIKANNNTYWMAENSRIFRDSYNVSEKDTFVEEYKKDENSIFNLLVLDENIVDVANSSNNIKEIRKLFGIEEHTKHTGGKAKCSKKAICEECGIEYGEYNKNNHNYDNGKITKEPTLENEGEKTYTCKDCGNMIIQKLPKLDKSNEEENDEKNNTENDNNNSNNNNSGNNGNNNSNNSNNPNNNNNNNNNQKPELDKNENKNENKNDNIQKPTEDSSKDNTIIEKPITDKNEQQETNNKKEDNKNEQQKTDNNIDESINQNNTNKENIENKDNGDNVKIEDDTCSTEKIPQTGNDTLKIYLSILISICIIGAIYYGIRIKKG